MKTQPILFLTRHTYISDLVCDDKSGTVDFPSMADLDYVDK
jgi:hypothetical protein